MSATFLSAVISALATPDARAQETSSPADAEAAADDAAASGGERRAEDAEASAYLVDWKLSDAEVNLVWDGYWRIRLVSGGAFGKKTGDNIFRGLSRGTAFVQEPDLTLSLWMNDRWFIETTFLEGFDRNTYRAGYVGRPGEFVREVTAGNAGVNADAFAGAEVPRPDFNTPGIVGKFATDRSDHQILLRYDPTDPETKTFFGPYEVNTQEIGLPEFVEGRYFLLPDTGVSNVAVYLEDANGSITGIDGMGTVRRYRRAEPVEYFVDETDGVLELAEAHGAQVAVYYAVGANDVGDNVLALGEDFVVTPDANLHPDLTGTISYSDFDFDPGTADPYDPAGRDFRDTSRVDIGGVDHLVLYTPGKFSPFERQNVYLSSRSLPEQSWRVVPMIKDRGSYPAVNVDYSFATDTGERTVEVYSPAVSGIREGANRYPFAAYDPTAYGPGRETDPDKFSRLLVLAVRESNSGYYLGSGVVPGSITVRINGVLDSSAEVSDDGYLVFSRYVYVDDWIEVSYRTESLDMEGGDLFLYQGNRFALAPNLTWELAETVRWNLGRESSVEEYGESPGEIAVSSVLDWNTDAAGLKLTADAALSTPDTVGNLRLYGMEKGELSLALFDETLVAAPSSVPGYGGANRADLDRFDYIAFDGLGREVLYDYLWPGASSTGGDGPALAADRSGDPTDGRVMDMRFALPAGDWSAGDALADTYGPVDLSGYTALEVPVRFLDDYGADGLGGAAPTIRLQIGEIGESADHHDDGSVNGADAGAYAEWDLAGTDVEWDVGDLDGAWADGSWHAVRIPLSSADRALLGSVRSWRLIIDNDTGGGVSGRMISGPPVLEGSSFRVEVREPDDDLAPAQDAAADEVIDTSLGSAYPENDSTFHAGGETNKALRIRWGDQATGGSGLGANRWEAVSWFSGVPMSSYRTAVFYVKPGQDATGALTARITDEDGRGITVSWTYGAGTAGTWDRIEVNIPEGTASSDSGAGFTVTVDKDAGELSRFLLSGADETGSAASSVDSGILYLDEVHFTDPAYSLTGSAGIDGYWNYPDDVAAIGEFPVLGDISVNAGTKVTGGKVLSGVDEGNTVTTGELGVGADVLGVGLRTDWRASWGLGERNWSGSHSLRIPARFETFWIGDAYSRGVSGDEATFTRRNDINLRLTSGSATLFGEAYYDGTSFVQSWGGETGWGGRIWETSLDVEYALETDREATAEYGYMESWARDYATIVPSGTAVGREAHHEFDGSVRWGPAALRWTPELRFVVSDSPDWNQTNTWGGTLSLPLRFEGWSLTPSYRRRLTQTIDTSAEPNGGFDDAWQTFFDGLSGQWPLFAYAPFMELFGSGESGAFTSLSAGLDEADYEAEFAVDARRSSGNHWADLFAPSGASASVTREYQRQGDTAGWEDEWTATLNFGAYNLFGNFGRYPLFRFYNTEELTGHLQLSLEGINETSAPSPEELTWQLNWGFEGSRKRRLVLDHRATWYWDADMRETVEEGRVEFHWRGPSKDVMHLPFINRAIPRRHHMESVERIAISGEYPWRDAPDDTALDFGVTLYHETSWVFQDLGKITGWLAFGLGGTDGLLTNGWEIGLEAEVHF